LQVPEIRTALPKLFVNELVALLEIAEECVANVFIQE
jgi:hypothetical protein